MLAELTAINAAYAVIKETVNDGKELTDCIKHLGSFFSIKRKLEHKVTFTPPSQRNQLEEFFALEEVRRKEKELRDYMLIAGRPGLLDDWDRFRKRHAEQEAAEAAERYRIAQEEAARVEEMQLLGCVIVLFLMCVGVIFEFVYIITR